jgi:ankyrin repeat protein
VCNITYVAGGQTPLGLALRRNADQIVRQLLKPGVMSSSELNAHDANGNVALHVKKEVLSCVYIYIYIYIYI